jgi:hypothetical protein
MAFKDFFHLNEYKYAKRISKYSNTHLQKQDVVKLRQFFAGALSLGSGIGAAPSTCGTTLLVSGYGVRRINVAYRKLKLIQSELLSRGITPHEMTKRDFFIPIAAFIVSIGVADCVEIRVGSLMAAHGSGGEWAIIKITKAIAKLATDKSLTRVMGYPDNYPGGSQDLSDSDDEPSNDELPNDEPSDDELYGLQDLETPAHATNRSPPSTPTLPAVPDS